MTHYEIAGGSVRSVWSEKDWRRMVLDAVQHTGWVVLFAVDDAAYRELGLLAKRSGSARAALERLSGYPDLHLGCPRTGVNVYVELKTDTGRVRPNQRSRIGELLQAGCDVRIWRPRYWDPEVQRVLTTGRVTGGGPGRDEAWTVAGG